jgi:arylsulfatase A-like enzyme
VLKRPNILLITCHDLGKHLGCYGIPNLNTPALDNLAEKGLLFRNSFATSPGCSPSRAAISTGKYPHNTGVLGLSHAHFGWDLNKNETHISKYFSDNGYLTVLFGLQHITYEDNSLGFNKIFPERSADDVVNNIKIYLSQQKYTHPLFLEINFFEPHRPFDFGGVISDKSKGVFIPYFIPENSESKNEFANFQGAIQKVDNSISAIITVLKDSGLYDDTVILFTTDHGIPFPKAKGTLYDPGIETCLIINYPKIEYKKNIFNELISNIDILPTLLEFAKIEIPKIIQGKSFFQLINNGKYFENEEIYAEKNYHESYDPIRSIRNKNYKLIVNFDADRSIHIPSDVMRGETYKTMINDLINCRKRFELFDLDLDYHEKNNLENNEKYSEIKRDLLKKLHEWMISTEDPLYFGQIQSPHYIKTINILKNV